MEKRKKKEHDFAVNAFRVVQEATGEIEPASKEPKPKKGFDDPKASGHRGGLKGGKVRAAKLTPEQRKEIAQKAARARWSKS
ncbi:histone H1 [bacterium]|nr:histone H1 [bacterium]